MTIAIVIAVAIILISGPIAADRHDEWYSQESQFWYNIHHLSLIDPAVNEKWTPIVLWTREHRLSWWRVIVFKWKPPDERMKEGTS